MVGTDFSQRWCSLNEINKSKAEKANESILNRKAMIFLCLNCIFYELIAGINYTDSFSNWRNWFYLLFIARVLCFRLAMNSL